LEDAVPSSSILEVEAAATIQVKDPESSQHRGHNGIKVIMIISVWLQDPVPKLTPSTQSHYIAFHNLRMACTTGKHGWLANPMIHNGLSLWYWLALPGGPGAWLNVLVKLNHDNCAWTKLKQFVLVTFVCLQFNDAKQITVTSILANNFNYQTACRNKPFKTKNWGLWLQIVKQAWEIQLSFSTTLSVRFCGRTLSAEEFLKKCCHRQIDQLFWCNYCNAAQVSQKNFIT
jgi:hypothetical protein